MTIAAAISPPSAPGRAAAPYFSFPEPPPSPPPSLQAPSSSTTSLSSRSTKSMSSTTPTRRRRPASPPLMYNMGMGFAPPPKTPKPLIKLEKKKSASSSASGGFLSPAPSTNSLGRTTSGGSQGSRQSRPSVSNAPVVSTVSSVFRSLRRGKSSSQSSLQSITTESIVERDSLQTIPETKSSSRDKAARMLGPEVVTPATRPEYPSSLTSSKYPSSMTSSLEPIEFAPHAPTPPPVAPRRAPVARKPVPDSLADVTTSKLQTLESAAFKSSPAFQRPPPKTQRRPTTAPSSAGSDLSSLRSSIRGGSIGSGYPKPASIVHPTISNQSSIEEFARSPTMHDTESSSMSSSSSGAAEPDIMTIPRHPSNPLHTRRPHTATGAPPPRKTRDQAPDSSAPFSHYRIHTRNRSLSDESSLPEPLVLALEPVSDAPSRRTDQKPKPLVFIPSDEPSTTYRREAIWSGEWNQADMKDVIEKLRNLR